VELTPKQVAENVELLRELDAKLRAERRTLEDRAERRAQRRMSAVLRAHEDMRCPSCALVVTNVASWCFSRHHRRLVCKSCSTATHRIEHFCAQEFAEPVRYRIKSVLFREAREAAGVGPTVMARACGWSLSQQMKLESGARCSIDADSVDVIVTELRLRGVECPWWPE